MHHTFWKKRPLAIDFFKNLVFYVLKCQKHDFWTKQFSNDTLFFQQYNERPWTQREKDADDARKIEAGNRFVADGMNF